MLMNLGIREVDIVRTVINACYDSLEADLKDFFALTKHAKDLDTINVIEVFTTTKKLFDGWQKLEARYDLTRVKTFSLKLTTFAGSRSSLFTLTRSVTWRFGLKN